MAYTHTASIHAYLGHDMEDVHERIFLESGTEITLPVLYLDEVILFPTETLPLRIKNMNLVSYLRTRGEQSNGSNIGAHPVIIGVIGRYFIENDGTPVIPYVGTVIEAVATKYEGETAVVMAKGRCRFHVLSRYIDNVYNVVMVRGRVLSDEVCTFSPGASNLHKDEFYMVANPLPSWVYKFYDPYHLMNRAKELQRKLHSFDHHSSTDSQSSRTMSLSDESDESQEESGGYMTADEGGGCVTEASTQRQSVSEELKADSDNDRDDNSYDNLLECDERIEDPVNYSFRVAGDLVLPDSDRQKLLEANGVADRLRLIVDYLEDKIAYFECRHTTGSIYPETPSRNVDESEEESVSSPSGISASRSGVGPAGVLALHCKDCMSVVAREDMVFQVPGAQGAVGAYVNPHGCVHQTVTVRKILQSKVLCHGRPSNEDTWFPGYSWTIAYCGNCYNHLGWKFTLDPVTDPGIDQSVLCKSFWGLRRSAVCSGIACSSDMSETSFHPGRNVAAFIESLFS
mmetsp:Transcript_3125/g.4826  ORF Transcript_3125/g.4826 Transcript_3125/m.4826 type:complete len:514 (-) Transcript_3125:61-1602(-)